MTVLSGKVGRVHTFLPRRSIRGCVSMGRSFDKTPSTTLGEFHPLVVQARRASTRRKRRHDTIGNDRGGLSRRWLPLRSTRLSIELLPVLLGSHHLSCQKPSTHCYAANPPRRSPPMSVRSPAHARVAWQPRKPPLSVSMTPALSFRWLLQVYSKMSSACSNTSKRILGMRYPTERLA